MTTVPKAGRGRPRDPRTQEAILVATRRLLVEVGYDQLSIDAIAREAGIGRPTIYRRWPSLVHIVFDATFGSRPDDGDMPTPSGEFRTDLHRFVRRVLQFWREPVVAAAALGILAESHRDPELEIRTQQLLDEQARAGFGALVRSGVEQGLVRADLDVEMLYDLLVGTTFYAAQVLQRDDIDHTVDRLCSLIIQGVSTNGEEP